MNSIVETLQATYLFKNNPILELNKISTLCKTKHVQKGEILISKGDVPLRMLIVVFGSILMSIEKDDGTEEPITILGSEQILSSEGFYDEGGKSIFTARAMENCDLLEIDYADLHYLFATNHLMEMKCHRSFQKFSTNIMQTMASRLSEVKLAKFF